MSLSNEDRKKQHVQLDKKKKRKKVALSARFMPIVSRLSVKRFDFIFNFPLFSFLYFCHVDIRRVYRSTAVISEDNLSIASKQVRVYENIYIFVF